ncbi:hypothetical protein J132_10912 [Termitomyces sp. J132]|nr:hypothetical protein C0989_003405 [Termitomyces sp. Mn162]KAH0581774.1 hypothetical protein H2248_011456 [Termitomyces sp. 'cryptogamus']KNZ76964.1 hypothetical protein J132_10912 [Termitomyces sp. J132]
MLRQALRSFSTSGSPTSTSTVYRGTAFERRAQNILQNHLSMSLRRVGGKSDGGVDLLGWWWLPPSGAFDINMPRRRLRVLAQCKAEKKKIGPKFIREMEGVLHRYLSLSTSSCSFDSCNQKTHTSPVAQVLRCPVVALFISESPYTRSAILRAQSSPVPLFLLHIPPESSISDSSATEGSYDERIGSAVWNPALAGARGLLSGEIDIRWERDIRGSGRPGMWWRNQKLANWNSEVDESEMGSPDLEQENVLLEELA